MPGVLVLGKRKGTNASGLRLSGMLATLSPVVGKPLTQAAGVRVEGGEVAEKGSQAEDNGTSGSAAGVLLKESWLVGDPADAASMLRL
eukprot:4163305-Pleurochrysis_carterae.AAC.1